MGAALASKIENDYQIITLPMALDKDAVIAIESQSKRWLLEPVLLHIFDFSATMQIHHSAHHFFANYKRRLTENGKLMASFGLRDNMHRELHKAGMTLALMPQANLEKALELLPPAKRVVKRLDATILEYFIEGTVLALKQASVEVIPGKPSLKKENLPGIAIAGILSFNSEALPGSIALCFTREVFLKIYESMIGEKPTDITDENQDAAAELLNILYGHAKTKLILKNIPVDRAIPVVMVGEKLRTQMGDKDTSMILPFTCAFGTFHIEIGIFSKG